MRLNLGCGKHPMEGWLNIDQLDGVHNNISVFGEDIFNLPYPPESVAEFHSSHMIEHITHVLPLMDELYRVAKPDAIATFACPYGSSDDAWENPTHVRPMFVGSWGFFGQPHYWREDYGYRADWVTERVHLRVREAVWSDHNCDPYHLWNSISHSRNVVGEMVAVLRAQKPARPADRELQGNYPVVIETLTPTDPWNNEVREVGRLMFGSQKPAVDAEAGS